MEWQGRKAATHAPPPRVSIWNFVPSLIQTPVTFNFVDLAYDSAAPFGQPHSDRQSAPLGKRLLTERSVSRIEY